MLYVSVRFDIKTRKKFYLIRFDSKNDQEFKAIENLIRQLLESHKQGYFATISRSFRLSPQEYANEAYAVSEKDESRKHRGDFSTLILNETAITDLNWREKFETLGFNLAEICKICKTFFSFSFLLTEVDEETGKDKKISEDKQIENLILFSEVCGSVVDSRGETVLHWLIGRESLELLSKVAQKMSVCINVKSKSGDTPLEKALFVPGHAIYSEYRQMERDNIQGIDLALEKWIKEKKQTQSAISHSDNSFIYYGKVIEILIDAGADHDLEGDDFSRAFFIDYLEEYYKKVKALIIASDSSLARVSVLVGLCMGYLDVRNSEAYKKDADKRAKAQSVIPDTDNASVDGGSVKAPDKRKLSY